MELSMHRFGMSVRVFSWCGSRAGKKLHRRSATTRGNSQSLHARRKPGHRAFPAVGLSAPLCRTPAPGRGALRTCFTILFFPSCSRAKPCRSGDAMGVSMLRCAAALPQLKDERGYGARRGVCATTQQRVRHEAQGAPFRHPAPTPLASLKTRRFRKRRPRTDLFNDI